MLAQISKSSSPIGARRSFAILLAGVLICALPTLCIATRVKADADKTPPQSASARPNPIPAPRASVGPADGPEPLTYLIEHQFVEIKKNGEKKVLSGPRMRIPAGDVGKICVASDSHSPVWQVLDDRESKLPPAGKLGDFVNLTRIKVVPANGGNLLLDATFEKVEVKKSDKTGVRVTGNVLRVYETIKLGETLTLELESDGREGTRREVRVTVRESDEQGNLQPPRKRMTEEQAEKEFKVAEFYLDHGRMVSAYSFYDIVCRRYAGSEWAEKAAKRMEKLRPLVEKDER